MRRFTRILLVLLNSLSPFILVACANRAPSLRMLDTRAAYNAPFDDDEVGLYQKSRSQGDSLGRSSGPRIVKVYLYPHELPTQDYFWGGYVSLIVRKDEVLFDRPDDTESESDTPVGLPTSRPGKRK
jgi:hypothetical protein